MYRLFYFASVFILAGSSSALSYSPVKNTRMGLPLGVVLGMLGSGLWIAIARTATEPKEVLAIGLTGEIVGKCASLAIPFALYGLKCDWKAAAGMTLMVSGVLVWR